MNRDEVDLFLLDAQAHAQRSSELYGFADVYAILDRCRKLNSGNWRNLFPAYADAHYTNRP